MSKISIGKQLSSLKPGARLTISKVTPCGSIFARKSVSGAITLFWRYTHAEHNQLVHVGLYDATAHPRSTIKTDEGYSIAAAIFQAEKLARLHFENKENGGYLQVQKKQEIAKNEMHLAQIEAKNFTLESLLISYCEYLEKIGRKAYKDARNIFKKDVISAWSKLADLPACDITSEQVADILRRIHENGHARTSNKLRNYMRAAYQVAKSAKNKASIPANFKSFHITQNPAADTEPDTSANRSDRNPLTITEMQIYWHCIKAITGFKGAVLRLHLLTGGLRIEQLVNLKTINTTEDTITLHDIKGRTGGGSPRPYTTPLITAAAQSLSECDAVGVYALSTDYGKTHLSAITFGKWSRDATDSKIPNFTAKRIRSGIETLLAKQKFSKDLRGRLQSHGISGVQDKHYDGHDYVDEKREMLEVLFKVLEAGQA